MSSNLHDRMRPIKTKHNLKPMGSSCGTCKSSIINGTGRADYTFGAKPDSKNGKSAKYITQLTTGKQVINLF